LFPNKYAPVDALWRVSRFENAARKEGFLEKFKKNNQGKF